MTVDNWPFEEWGRFLPDQSAAVSLLDRLLHHNVLVVTEGESFRMKEARQNSSRGVGTFGGRQRGLKTGHGQRRGGFDRGSVFRAADSEILAA